MKNGALHSLCPGMQYRDCSKVRSRGEQTRVRSDLQRRPQIRHEYRAQRGLHMAHAVNAAASHLIQHFALSHDDSVHLLDTDNWPCYPPGFIKLPCCSKPKALPDYGRSPTVTVLNLVCNLRGFLQVREPHTTTLMLCWTCVWMLAPFVTLGPSQMVDLSLLLVWRLQFVLQLAELQAHACVFMTAKCVEHLAMTFGPLHML